MIKHALLLLTFLGLAAASHAAPAALSDENLANETVARLGASAHVREWNLASNDSNSPEIYAKLIKAGGVPACHEKRILVNSEYVTKTDCAVTARVAHLTVEINDIVYRSTTEVDVIGEASCRAEWMSIAQGRRQVAELWHFCRFSGVALPK